MNTEKAIKKLKKSNDYEVIYKGKDFMVYRRRKSQNFPKGRYCLFLKDYWVDEVQEDKKWAGCCISPFEFERLIRSLIGEVL